jgi:NADPH2:quinone reductase
MRAMVINEFGGPEVFVAQEIEKPEPGPNEVLIKVRASSVNPADAAARRGMPGPHPAVTLPAVLGYDAAGIVESIGSGVTSFAVGDSVFGIPIGGKRGGAYAEYCVASIDSISKMPNSRSFEEAAAVPVAGGVAWTALISRAKLSIGETALIHGGAGGVGSFAVQMAKAAGAFVCASCAQDDMERVRALGADCVLDYKCGKVFETVLAETNGKGVDVSFTTVGGPTFAESFAATREGGRVVTITGPEQGLEAAQFIAVSRNLTLHFVHLDEVSAKLAWLSDLMERGQIKPLISHVYPLSKVGEAHHMQESRGENVYGKIIVRID